MQRLTLPVAFIVAVVGCQRPASESANPSAQPVAVAPAPTGGGVIDVSDARLAGSDPLTTEEALCLIGGIREDGDLDRVLAVGDRLFPAFEEILNRRYVAERYQVSVLELAGDMKGDPSRFLPHAVRRLSSESGNLRRAAVGFLGNAGTEREAALVTLMLLDKDSTVQHAAATALARIGGEREVAVFDLILHNARRYEEDGFLILDQHMIEVYEKHRDELKARLVKEKKDDNPADKK